MQQIKKYIDKNLLVKKFIHFTLMPRNQAKPRFWVRHFLNRFFHKKGKGSLIRNHTRMDVFPFNRFAIGSKSTIEDFSAVNNAVGSVVIGSSSRIGLSNVLIGPVTIGNDVILAQNVVVSGLNHNYSDINTPVRKQGVNMHETIIEDGAWIGANTVITAGVKIGRNSVIAAGSVVTKEVPAFSVAAGNPARLLKKHDKSTGEWVKANVN